MKAHNEMEDVIDHLEILMEKLTVLQSKELSDDFKVAINARLENYLLGKHAAFSKTAEMLQGIAAMENAVNEMNKEASKLRDGAGFREMLEAETNLKTQCSQVMENQRQIRQRLAEVSTEKESLLVEHQKLKEEIEHTLTTELMEINENISSLASKISEKESSIEKEMLDHRQRECEMKAVIKSKLGKCTEISLQVEVCKAENLKFQSDISDTKQKISEIQKMTESEEIVLRSVVEQISCSESSIQELISEKVKTSILHSMP